MNPRLYFDEKTLKKLGDVFVVNRECEKKSVKKNPSMIEYK